MSLGYFTRRLLALVPVWLIATFAAFALIHAIPGGPFDTGGVQTAATTRALDQEFHLNRPLVVQYALYLEGIFEHGDLGDSAVQRGLTATDVLRSRLPTSATLALTAFLVAVGVGLPAGILAALRRNSLTDRLVMVGASLGYAIPNFVLSLALILIVGSKLQWLPLGGWGGVKRAILPAIALGLPWAGFIARLMRAAIRETMTADHVRMAKAKGLTPGRVVVRHIIRNALIPVVTFFPVLVAQLILGAIVVEEIFGIPGIGTYFVNSVTGRDYTLMLGFIVFYTTLVFAANFVADMAYAWLDPRIRLE